MDDEGAVHAEESAFLQCKASGYTIASTDGGFVDETWSAYLEERVWMASNCFKREGDDCPRGTRGPAVYDFETPVVRLAHPGSRWPSG
jgi:hypothetical protein